jgi:hypothetical protein
MCAILVYADKHRMETSAMTINGKDIHVATDGKIYSFSGFGGFMNCSKCDNDTAVNEYDRQDDGAVMWFCKPCEDRLHL